MKRAFILDLDNTIYPVSSISENLFQQLFDLLSEFEDSLSYDVLLLAKDELTRKHFHLVADKYNFSPELKSRGIHLLNNMEYSLPMQTFEEYSFVRDVAIDKYLVTLGFTKLQQSKVKMLGIGDDMKEVHIVDPEVSSLTKKDVFADIMQRHGYKTEEVLVIGDDPGSEIKAATELGIDTFLFDPDDKYPDAVVTHRVKQLRDIVTVL